MKFFSNIFRKKGGAKKAKKDASIKSMSEANSKMWETRLTLTEQSLMEYRDNARRLVLENDTLQNQVSQTEKDTIDVITYLKRQDQEKDKQVRILKKISSTLVSSLFICLFPFTLNHAYSISSVSENYFFNFQIEKISTQMKDLKKENRQEKETLVRFSNIFVFLNSWNLCEATIKS